MNCTVFVLITGKCPSFLYKVIIVNDGSSDKTDTV